LPAEDHTETNIHHKWRSIQDLSAWALSFRDPELDSLRKVWQEQQLLDDKESVKESTPG